MSTGGGKRQFHYNFRKHSNRDDNVTTLRCGIPADKQNFSKNESNI